MSSFNKTIDGQPMPGFPEKKEAPKDEPKEDQPSK